MKAYNPPKVIMHEQVEFGTVNISNNFFYRWCKQFNFRPFICRLFFGSGSVGGDMASTSLSPASRERRSDGQSWLKTR